MKTTGNHRTSYSPKGNNSQNATKDRPPFWLWNTVRSILIWLTDGTVVVGGLVIAYTEALKIMVNGNWAFAVFLIAVTSVAAYVNVQVVWRVSQ